MNTKHTIYINGIEAYNRWGLIARDGFIADLLKPANPKAYIKNTAADIDGTEVDARYRKIDGRSFSVLIYMKADSLAEFIANSNDLERVLIEGINGTGITELSVLGQVEMTFRCVYENYSTYKPLNDSGKALLSISFYEPNVRNRELNV